MKVSKKAIGNKTRRKIARGAGVLSKNLSATDHTLNRGADKAGLGRALKTVTPNVNPLAEVQAVSDVLAGNKGSIEGVASVIPVLGDAMITYNIFKTTKTC